MLSKFGGACDICGKIDQNNKIFYRLVIPTYESDINNSLQRKDYCLSCYKELKMLLKTYYEDKENAE